MRAAAQAAANLDSPRTTPRGPKDRAAAAMMLPTLRGEDRPAQTPGSTWHEDYSTALRAANGSPRDPLCQSPGSLASSSMGPPTPSALVRTPRPATPEEVAAVAAARASMRLPSPPSSPGAAAAMPEVDSNSRRIRFSTFAAASRHAGGVWVAPGTRLDESRVQDTLDQACTLLSSLEADHTHGSARNANGSPRALETPHGRQVLPLVGGGLRTGGEGLFGATALRFTGPAQLGVRGCSCAAPSITSMP